MNDSLAVIFDMDGVLVDTYDAHFRSWQAVAAEEGQQFTEDDFAPTFGRTSREIIAALWSSGAMSDEEIARIDDRKEALFREIIRESFPAMPGAVELIEELRGAGFKLGVGSSGPPANVEEVLEKLGAKRHFSAIVTGADVTRGKPDPQVFLLAAERLAVPPARCAVVEDAVPGVEAAETAGMTSIGLVSTGRTHEQLAGADLVVDRLDELSSERLRRLIGQKAF